MVTLCRRILSLQIQIILIQFVSPDTGITIRKCCPRGSRLLDISKLKCTTLPSFHSSEEQNYDWIPRPLEDDDGQTTTLSESQFNVEYGLGPQCNMEDRQKTKTLYFKPEEEAFRIFANNGSLVEMKRLGNHTWRVGFFTDKSFCVDSVRNDDYTHAAKLCLCAEKTCIQKCCSYGKYLNTDKNDCVPNKPTLPNYMPVIYDDDLLPIMNPPTDLYFMESLPRCQPRGFDVLNGVDKTAATAFFIQSSGNVVLINDETNKTVLPYKFCFDMIQIDEETIGPNLAVCPDTNRTKTRRGVAEMRSSVEKVNGKRASGGDPRSAAPYLSFLHTLSLFTLVQRHFVIG